MIILGIDNGLSGGLASYQVETNTLTVISMPIVSVKSAKGNKQEYDLPAIASWFRIHSGARMVMLEKSHAFPGMGAQSTFMNGKNFGIMEGMLSALGLPYTIIHSKTWQKRMFEGIHHKDTKQASILVAQRLFPGTSFLPTERSKKPSDGMTDAALMAVYGHLIYK